MRGVCGLTACSGSTEQVPARALGDCALAEHSAPDLYSLELECQRAQEREELPALTRRQFLSG